MAFDRHSFGLEQHQSTASMLIRASDDLASLEADLEAAYGSSVAQSASDALDALERLRALLDAKLDRDIDRPVGLVGNVRLSSIYFPPRRGAARMALAGT